MTTSIKVLFFLICLYKSHCFTLSDRFKVCQRNDAKLDVCLADAIETGIKLLGPKGLSAIGVPSIDPLKISKIVIGAGTNAVNLVQNYFDINLLGLSKLKVDNAKFDLENKILTFTTHHPTIVQEAKYDINGKILVLPVYGKGDSIIKFMNPSITHVVHFDEETKGDKKYLKVTDYEALITIQGAHFDFKNLFNGDKKLGDNILNVVNENWKEIFEDVKEGVEKSYGKVFEAVATIFFNKIPIDEILPN